MITAMLLPLLMAQPAAPKSFEDMMAQTRAAYRSLKSYRDSWFMKTTAGDQEQLLKFERQIDGERGSMKATLDGEVILQLGSDGKASFFMVPGFSKYAEFSGKNPWITRDPKDDEKLMQDGDFNVTVDGIYDILVTSKPSLKLLTFTPGKFEGQDVRVAKCEVRRPDTKSGVDMTITFEKGKMLIVRLECDVIGRDSSKANMVLLRESSAEGAKLDPTQFEMPKSVTSSYSKAPWEEIVPGFYKH
ncbi:MAG: hypothetical protein JST40_02445 [Armatimonadetes bacterium]|nr:hypothetical protein [Armatimonadota bacterium]